MKNIELSKKYLCTVNHTEMEVEVLSIVDVRNNYFNVRILTPIGWTYVNENELKEIE